jgi:hypothetical protein
MHNAEVKALEDFAAAAEAATPRLSSSPWGVATREVAKEARRTIAEHTGQARPVLTLVLGGDLADTPAPKPPKETPAQPKPKRRKASSGGATSVKAAEDRAEQVFGFLKERGGMVGAGEIRKEFGWSPEQIRTACRRLVKDGRANRRGERQHTQYEAVGDGPATVVPPLPPKPPTAGGTLQGRILGKVEADGFVTLDELAVFTGEDSNVVLRECGMLIRENEIRMDRRDGKPGYVPA